MNFVKKVFDNDLKALKVCEALAKLPNCTDRDIEYIQSVVENIESDIAVVAKYGQELDGVPKGLKTALNNERFASNL